MLVLNVAFVLLVASGLWGCGFNARENFVSVVEAARKDDFIQKADRAIVQFATRVARTKDPQAKNLDYRIAHSAARAILVYVEAEKLCPDIYQDMTKIIAAASSIAGNNHMILFDMAVSNLVSKSNLYWNSKTMVMPSYEVYEFGKAVFQLLTDDDQFDISSKQEIDTALRCAAKGASSCQGPSRNLTDNVFGLMARVSALIPPANEFPPNIVRFHKIVFLPFYIVLTRETVSKEFRELFVRVIEATVDLLENAPKNPEEARMFYSEAFSGLRYGERYALNNIRLNINYIMTRIGLGRYILPSNIHIQPN